jgi:hypothetical protein
MNSPSETGGQHDDRSGSTIERIQLEHPRDLLAAIPYLLGFHPDDSVVIVALADGQVALTIRVDLGAGDVMTLNEPHAMWARLSPPLTEVGVDTVALIAYADRDAETGVLAFAGASPWPVLDVLRAHGQRWWSLTCPLGPSCCPSGELSEPNPAVAVPLAVGSGAPAASRQALAGCLQPGPPVLVEAVARLLPLDPSPARSVLTQAIVTAHTERVDGPIPLGPAQAALLLHAVTVVEVRDGCCAWHDEAACWLWTDLIHAAPPGWVAPVATLLATTAYQRGNSILAQLAAAHALTDDPGYRLARLVDGMVTAQIHPALVRDALDYAVREATAHHNRSDEPRPQAAAISNDGHPAGTGSDVTAPPDTTEGGTDE